MFRFSIDINVDIKKHNQPKGLSVKSNAKIVLQLNDVT